MAPVQVFRENGVQQGRAIQAARRIATQRITTGQIRATLAGWSQRSARRLLALLLPLLLSLGAGLTLGLGAPQPAAASLTNNTYDGNIYALYAGNGSLVPPRRTLEQALAEHRPTLVVYYLDDDAASKQFSPVVSELQRLWGNSIELIPLVTDPLQNRRPTGPEDPATYWHGHTPQVVVFNAEGRVLFDGEGAVSLEAINQAVSEATGIPLPEGFRSSTTVLINELNAEVVSR